MRLVILRPPLVCGPGVSGNLGTLVRLAALPLPLPLGGIANRRTLLSIGNLVDLVDRVLKQPVAGTYVIGDREPLSTSSIVRHLRGGLGRAPGLVSVPAGLARHGRVGWSVGRGLALRRLLGDLELDSTRFRAAYDWRDVVDTAAALRETAAARGG